jgi:hypothetical protein
MRALAETWVNPVSRRLTQVAKYVKQQLGGLTQFLLNEESWCVLSLGTDQFGRVDGLRSNRRWTGRPLGKESTIVDLLGLAFQHIEEIFLQGLPTSLRLVRQRTASDL